MRQSVRMVDVANRAGVSIAAVGCVLQGTGGNTVRVGRETALRIQKIADEMNYSPNLAARQLVGKRSRTIGILIDPLPKLANSIRLAEITRHARELGYHTIILHEEPRPKLIKECLDEFVGRGVDGLVCVHHYYPHHHDLIPKVIQNSSISSIVYIDRPDIDGVYYVGLDFEEVTKKIVGHLVKRGRKRIGFVTGTLEWYSAPRLLRGYQEALRENGLEVEADLVWVGTERSRTNPDLHHITAETAERIIDELVVNCGADAIISEDNWSARLLNCLVDRGYKVPDEISVAGAGNLEVGEYTKPSLTTVDFRYGIIARSAVDMLIENIENRYDEHSPRGRFVSPELIIRDSA